MVRMEWVRRQRRMSSAGVVRVRGVSEDANGRETGDAERRRIE